MTTPATVSQANKATLVDHVAQELAVPERTASRLLDAVLGSFCELLRERRKIIVKGFGTFECKMRKGRTYRHPLTGSFIAVPDRETILFKPSELLLEVTRESA
jgi:nucleoid DNA-binding protein